ncbi:unnamed protein product [Urochloa humidicola]
MPTMTVPSAAMRQLRREGLEISRRRTALAPTGGVTAKKPSTPPPNTCVLALPVPVPPRPTPAAARVRKTTRPPAPRRVPDAEGARQERSRPTPSSARPCANHAAAPAAEPPVEAIKNKRIGKGAQVRVRTRVGTARSTGQPIVLWLLAVVDSADDDGDDGCLRVTYSNDINGKLPRVAPGDVRLHDVAPLADGARGTAASSAGYSSAVTSDRSARPMPQQNKVAPPRPRPTVAGKKLPLLKKFEKEMKNRSDDIIGCW